ncbi:iron complex outermembrane receptor protein [Sphingobium sp. B2D3B]|uniref:TonB-dependent receptor n=2 Tax=unclassified Sphingobium TaxID=2611147 RepID=UPI0022241DD7|nr:TonB-dependent receptor [Sphingobium sp. B2D3B]MCW2381101.1 iron complex outermembrane receptor protein [Sphingobium sp. B2D3B]
MMKKADLLLQAASALTLGAATLATPAMAQDAPAPQQSAAQQADADDIVVTAQFRSQRLQDAPLAITAVSGDMLEARSQTSIAQVAAQAPNVNLAEAPATYGPSIQAFIRGVGQSDSTFALEPGVGLYVDDVYYSTLQGSMLDLLDLDRVEILRGPQGTLAGQNSIGGAIKLYSKKPDGSGGGYVQATYGSFNRTEVRGGLNLTVVPDQLFLRVSGAGVKKDGYVTRYDYRCTHPASPVRTFAISDNCKLGTEGGKSYVAGRGTLRWTPNDAVDISIIGDITRDDSESAPSTLLYVGTLTGPGSSATAPYVIDGVRYGTATGSPFISYSPYGNFAQDTFTTSPFVSYENYLNYAPRDGTAPYAAPARNSLDTWGLSGNITIDVGDLSITSITAYRSYNSVFTSAESSPINIALTANDVNHNQFSQELRASGAIGTLLNYTVGGYYFEGTSDGGSRVQLPTLEFRQNDHVESQTIAAFANAELHLTEKLTLIGGLRYTDITKSFQYARKGNPGNIYGGNAPPSLAPLDGLVRTFKGDRLDYRGVIQYRWTPDFMTYAQIATGFKSGGANPRPFFPAQALTHDPETLTAYEVGFKSDLFDRLLRLNVSGFLNKYNDILVSVSTCPTVPAAPCALPLNAGKADVKGFEVEATLRPVRGLLIDASLGYLDFDYKSISAIGQSAGITLDMDAPFVQEWRWSVGGQYKIELGDAGSLTPRIDVNSQSPYFSTAINRAPFNQVEGRTIVNARLTYRDVAEDWQLSLEVTNLTDRLYYDGLFDNRGSTQSIQGRPARPREWAVTIKRNF